MKNNRGSVTIFLTILLVPMLIISGVFVDVGRYQLAKAYVSNAADLTLRSHLANYDSALKEVYGLFAISQKEQGSEANATYSEYFKDNLGMDQDEYMIFLNYIWNKVKMVLMVLFQYMELNKVHLQQQVC